MKKQLLIIITFFIGVSLFSDENINLRGFYGQLHSWGIYFKEGGKLELERDGRQGSYTVTNENGINFMNILWDDNTNDKYLMLYGYYFLYLYNSDGEPFFYGEIRNDSEEVGGYMGGYSGYDLISPAEDFSASSSLKEGNTIYSPNKLNEKIGECWVEGVAGQGINERVILKAEKKEGWHYITGIYISIGYVSYSKPYLYLQNSRPKKIEILVNGKSLTIVELKDTPNFQIIGGSTDFGGYGDFEIKILEVYEGTKYEDTCINTILFERSPM